MPKRKPKPHHHTNTPQLPPHITQQYESEPAVQERFSSAMTLAWAHYEREFLRAMAERSVAPAKAQDVVRGIFNDAVCMHACMHVYM